MSPGDGIPRHARGIALFQAGRLADARAEFLRAAALVPDDWSAWYWAGQSARYDHDFESAHEHLSRAAQLAPRQTSALLALGIVLQLMERFGEAVTVLGSAIALDGDFAIAYNSLGVTHRKMGALDKALITYDAGTKALARTFVRSAQNSITARILPFEDIPGTRWLDCAMFGALFNIASSLSIDHAAFPDGAFAENELRTQAHGGLYWVDLKDGADTHRLFLPNYFHAFREFLKVDLFCHLIGNQAEIHRIRGETGAATELIREAQAFGNPAVSTSRVG